MFYGMCELGANTLYIAAKSASAAENVAVKWADDHGYSQQVEELGGLSIEGIGDDVFWWHYHHQVPNAITILARG